MTPHDITRALPPMGFALGHASRRRAVVWLALGLVGTTMLLGSVRGARRMHVCFSSKEAIAKATVCKYAFEAYPYLKGGETRDPWGREYQLIWMPRLAVASAGPDGLFGTGDDLWSAR